MNSSKIEEKMPGENIENLEGLLSQYIGPHKKIVDIKKGRLTAPGENYCSIMLKLEITVNNLKTGNEEKLHAVAKAINLEVSDFFRDGAPRQFEKEIAFYTEIVPILEEFQKEQGINEIFELYPKLYAARRNLHGNDGEIDDGSVIILENLKEQGYSCIDRVIGFDLEGAKLILENLAKLHAVPLGLKLKKPEVFEKKVKQFCDIKTFSIPSKQDGPPKPPEWLMYATQVEKCKPYIENLCKVVPKLGENFYNRPYAEPFATFVHFDMWVNNTMQIQKDGKLIKNKFVDFQMYQYGSAINDVILFIFGSCQNSVSGEHLDELLKFYHTHFSATLEKLGVDTTPFEYSKFLDRVEAIAPSTILHILCMAAPIQGKRGEASVDVKSDALRIEALTDEAKEKIVHEICEFGKRGWL